MFSCRPRVELVAAGSRSPCVCKCGNASRAPGALPCSTKPCRTAPANRWTSLRSMKGVQEGEAHLPPQAPCPPRT